MVTLSFIKNESDRWLGPGAIIGWEHKQVLSNMEPHMSEYIPHAWFYIPTHTMTLVNQ